MRAVPRAARAPVGLRRLLFRLPIIGYRLRLGWLFGSRLLLLDHVGRRTGKPRRTVLEVVERDREPDAFVVASGWGPKAQWYRNVLHTPDVRIRVGPRSLAATAVPLSTAEGEQVFLRYVAKHPRTARWLVSHLLATSGDDYRTVGRQLPFVRLQVRDEG